MEEGNRKGLTMSSKIIKRKRGNPVSMKLEVRYCKNALASPPLSSVLAKRSRAIVAVVP